jgi:hypothetical protein
MEDEVATLSPAFMSFSNDGCRWKLPGAVVDYAYPAYPAAYSFLVEPIGVGQFTTARDELWNPLYNIHGDEIFRRLDYADDTNSGTIVWSYRFDAAASSVTTLRTVTGVDGPPSSSPTSATQATIWGDDDDGDPVVKGNVTLSLKSDFEYLDETLETYFSQARAWKIWYSANDADLIDAGLATRSHSPGGPRCIVSGAEIYTVLGLRGNDIDERGTPETEDDVIERYGYDAPFRAVTQIVRRRNAPSLTDLGDGSGTDTESGVGIYRFGNAERKLLEPIGSRKWKDPSGIYDRRTPEALAAVGHGYLRDALLDGILPPDPTHGIDITAEALFASRDGRSYRLTIEAGNVPAGPGGGFTVLDTRLVTVPHGSGVVFSYSAYIAGASKVRVGKLEVLVEGIYEEVPILPGTPGLAPEHLPYQTLTGGTISSTPVLACRVLVVLRRRTGERWGYGEYTQNGVGSYGDYDAVPYFSEQLTNLDFATDPAGIGSVDVGGGDDVGDSAAPTKGRIAGSGGNIPRLATTKDRPPIRSNSGSTKGSNAARANGAVTKSNRTGYGTPITSGGAGNGTPITSGGAGNGTPITSGGAGNGNAITSGGAGRGKPITSGGAGNGTAFGTRPEGNDLSNGSGRGVDVDFDLGNSQLDLGSGLQFSGGLESSYNLGNSRLQSGSGLQFGGGLESNFNLGNSRLQFGSGLQSGGGLQFGRGLQTGGQLGDRRGNSGAIARSNLNGLQNKGLGATSGNAGAVSKSNLNGLKGKPLGATSGNAGAISRSNLNGASGGLGSRSGNSGAIKRSGSTGKSLGSTSKVGGGKSSSSREKKSRPTPVFVFREFGEPVSGTFKLSKTESFDLKTAKKLPVKVTTWQAMLNGSDWTPELGTDFADRYYNELLEPSVSATTRGYSLDPDSIPFSNNCEIRYDAPDRNGRELKRETVELAIPNTLESDAWFQDPPTPDFVGPSPSNFHTVKNPERGTTVWPEPLIILP